MRRRRSLFAALVLVNFCLSLVYLPLARGQGNAGPVQELLSEPKEVPEVAVQSIEPGLEQANELLYQRFGGFLERQELGFDRSLLTLIRQDLQSLRQQAGAFFSTPAGAEPEQALSLFAPLLILLVLAVFYLLLERQFVRWTIRAQSWIHVNSSPWLTAVIRALILTFGRLFSILALILLSLFPIRALFGELPWTLFLTRGLLYFLVYRAIKTLLTGLLRLSIQGDRDQYHKKRVERFIGALPRTSLFFLLLLLLVETFDYHEQLAAFISFVFRLSLASLPVYLFFIKNSVLHLLPASQSQSGKIYQNLRELLDKNFNVLVGTTIVLLLFNAAGYAEATTYLLTRGYTLLVLATLWLLILGQLKVYIERREAEAKESGGKGIGNGDHSVSPLLSALYSWLTWVGTLTIVAFVIELLGFLEPFITLLHVPFVSIGSVELSLYSLLIVGLIALVTTLTVRLLRALLNAMLYPALGVEVGSAFAINTILSYAIFTLAFILSLAALGMRLSTLVIVFAALGVGIGFGLQNITENLISGFILLFGRAVKKGDFITVNDVYGRVEAVGARSVVVRTTDNYSMLIPSKEIVSGQITNWTFHDFFVRLHIPIGLAYDCDPELVREVLLGTARKHPDILADPAPEVWLTEFSDFRINYELLIYFDCRVTSPNALSGTFNFILWEALQEANLFIPFPQRDLHLRSVDETAQIPLGFSPQDFSNGADRADSPPSSEREPKT